MKIFKKSLNPSPNQEKKSLIPDFLQSADARNIYLHSPKKPRWMAREYRKFIDEGYKSNVVAHRCISLISRAVSNMPFSVESSDEAGQGKQAYSLLKSPNPFCSSRELMEGITAYLLIAGNAFIQVIRNSEGTPQELHLLKPDSVGVIVNKSGFAISYEKKIEADKTKRFPIHPITGASDILHIRNFNPASHIQGLSPFEPASYSIDQHNQAAKWNQSLLQNGARPSGALVVKQTENNPSQHLGEEQFSRLKNQIEENFSGYNNSGKPLLLEGGLDWKEMSLKPSDMDFMEMKNTSAREIALAFGIPAQMLGIPGDNNYSNMKEARLSMWEQTILPIAEIILEKLNDWLNHLYKIEGEEQEHQEFKLKFNYEEISALAPRRGEFWDKISEANFLNDEEKKKILLDEEGKPRL